MVTSMVDPQKKMVQLTVTFTVHSQKENFTVIAKT